MGSTSSVDLASCRTDELHYFEDVYFLVDKTLFKLPRHHFDDSPHFKRLFDENQGSSELRSPGGSVVKESRIHCLTDTNVDDFRQFLRVLYPRHFDAEELTAPQWISVLKLSTHWMFKKVREIAIRNLEAIPTCGVNGGVELLKLAFDYEVRQWLLQALRLLVNQNDLKEEDIQSLGLAKGIRVVSLQGVVTGVRLGREKGNKEVSQDEIDGLIIKAFPEAELPKVNGATTEKVSAGPGAKGIKKK